MSDTIDDEIEEATDKGDKRAPNDPNGGGNNPDGRPYADYSPCPLCGTDVLSLPGHLPCGND